MEATNNTEEQQKQETTQEQTEVSTTSTEQTQKQEEKEPYFDLGAIDQPIEKVPVPVKHISETAYGHKQTRIRIAKLYSETEKYMNHIITIAGWARTTRAGGKDFCFVELFDGSFQKGVQVVVFKEVEGFENIIKCNVGTSFKFTGTLIKSPAKGQPFELQLSQTDKHKAVIFGHCDAGKYPLAKKRHTVEYLREIAHLRPRTNLFGAVTRVRNNLAYATHIFFQERGFQYIHTPIITASDCEGAGQMLQVTTILPEPHDSISKIPTNDGLVEEKKEEVKESKKDKKKAKKEKKAKDAAATTDETKAEGEETKVEEQPKTDEQVVQQQQAIPFEERKVNYKKDLFGKPSFLTVSGQLNVENYACAVGDVYTFGPTFRAENSHTSRHLSEFWMIEPEIAFATLEDNMATAEDYLKFCLNYVLTNNIEELQFFDQFVEKGLIERLRKVHETPFKRVAYTEGIEILERDIKDKKVKFDNKVFWGVDLASEHEKYLTDKIFEGPIILYNYPKDIKAFYMKMNEDGKTVQAMDVLVPRIGELIGGSAREDNLELLDKRIEDCKLEKESYWWYRQLREYGSIPHAGFGLGFERLVMMSTGVENIRDVIPFPRAPGAAEF